MLHKNLSSDNLLEMMDATREIHCYRYDEMIL